MLRQGRTMVRCRTQKLGRCVIGDSRARDDVYVICEQSAVVGVRYDDAAYVLGFKDENVCSRVARCMSTLGISTWSVSHKDGRDCSIRVTEHTDPSEADLSVSSLPLLEFARLPYHYNLGTILVHRDDGASMHLRGTMSHPDAAPHMFREHLNGLPTIPEAGTAPEE
jgi:hypothetical protein